MLSRSGAQSRSSFVGTSEVKTPVRLAFHSASSPVLALAVEKLNEDKQLEEIKAVLKSRKVSVATPGVSGAARLEVLKQRLYEDRDKEIAMVQYQQKRRAAETKHAAFKAYRSEQARKRLEMAVASGDASKIMAAVTSGADPNHVCRGGTIAIHQATENDDADLIVVLAKDGADVNKKSSYLQLDRGRHDFEQSSILEEGSVETISSVDVTTRVGPTPLILACLRSCLSTVTALLGVGADPNVSARVLEHDDIAPLAIAVARNDENIARALLDAGAVKHWMDPHGRSPLMYAARCASTDCVKLLVDRGADPNAIDYEYKTALDWATIASMSPDPAVAASREALCEIIRNLTLQTYQTRPIWKCDDGTVALESFPVDSLLTCPRPHFVAPLRTAPPSRASRRTDDAPAVVFCNHCAMQEARIRCVQCGQQQCEKCCVLLHSQDGRRHHILKAIKSMYSADNQQVLALCRLPSASLGNSIGIAKQTLEKMKEIYDESPLGSVTLLRDLEDKLKLEEMTKEIKEAAKQKLEHNGGMRNGRRSSIDVQFLKKNKGLELFPVMTEARRKSDAAVARQIAIERAREKVRHLFDQAPELDLADFYISNDKHPDAEAVLTAFLRDLKDKVPEEEWIWFRTRALVVKVKMRQRLWGAAVSAGKEALEPLHVREDEKFADPAVVAVVLAMADALVRLHDAEHGAALLKSCVARVFHCEKDSKIRAAITQYMDKFDAVHCIWEASLMSTQDKMIAEEGRTSSAAKESVEATESELFSIISQRRWFRAFKRVCRNDGTVSSLRFVLSVRQFRTLAKEALPQAAAELMRKFIKNPSILPVLPMVIKNRLRDNLKLQTTPMSFDECEKVVLDALVRGPLARFLASDDGKKYCRHRRKIAASYEKVDVSSLAKGKRERLFEAPAEASDVAQADQEAGPIDVDDSGVLAAYDGTGSDTDGVWDLSGYDSGGLTGDDTAALEYSAEEYAAMTEALVVYMKRYDYESGFPYFVNASTGETTWEVPPPYRTEAEFPYRTVCGQCNAATATKHCADCDNSFCEPCFIRLHGRGSFRQHRYIPLTDYDPVCCTCYVRFGLRSCLQCQTSYCTPCLVHQHAMNAWSGHTFTTVEFGVPDASSYGNIRSADHVPPV